MFKILNATLAFALATAPIANAQVTTDQVKAEALKAGASTVAAAGEAKDATVKYIQDNKLIEKAEARYDEASKTAAGRSAVLAYELSHIALLNAMYENAEPMRDASPGTRYLIARGPAFLAAVMGITGVIALPGRTTFGAFKQAIAQSHQNGLLTKTVTVPLRTVRNAGRAVVGGAISTVVIAGVTVLLWEGGSSILMDEATRTQHMAEFTTRTSQIESEMAALWK